MTSHDHKPRGAHAVRLRAITATLFMAAVLVIGVADNASAVTDPAGSGASVYTYVDCSRYNHTADFRTVAYSTDTAIMRRVWMKPSGGNWAFVRFAGTTYDGWEGVGGSTLEVLPSLIRTNYSVYVEYRFRPSWTWYQPWTYAAEWPQIWQAGYSTWISSAQCGI